MLSIIIVLMYQLNEFAKTSLSIRSSIASFYHYRFSQKLFDPELIFCSQYKLQQFYDQLDYIHSAVIQDLPCAVSESGITNISEHVLQAQYSAICGSNEISWLLLISKSQRIPNGCTKVEYKLKFSKSDIQPNIIITLLGLIISILGFTDSAFQASKPTYMNIFCIHIFSFLIILGAGSIDKTILHTLLCIQCTISLVGLSKHYILNYSDISPTSMYLAPLLLFPFVICMLIGGYCPSYSKLFASIRSSFALLFADYVFPSFLEFTALPSINCYVACILALTYMLFSLVCLANFASEQYIKYKNHAFIYQGEPILPIPNS